MSTISFWFLTAICWHSYFCQVSISEWILQAPIVLNAFVWWNFLLFSRIRRLSSRRSIYVTGHWFTRRRHCYSAVCWEETICGVVAEVCNRSKHLLIPFNVLRDFFLSSTSYFSFQTNINVECSKLPCCCLKNYEDDGIIMLFWLRLWLHNTWDMLFQLSTRMKQYQDELLHASLLFSLNLPIEITQGLLPNLASTVKVQ